MSDTDEMKRPNLPAEIDSGDWTFNGASTRQLTHCYHDYPARMIPQVAGKLLDQFGVNAKFLFDPYCGTGTSLVEGLVRGINVIGTDLNPLARLIARAKTSAPDSLTVDTEISRFRRFAARSKPLRLVQLPIIDGIRNLEFWFKPAVIGDLSRLRNFIGDIQDDSVRVFFQVAFSETVRDCSNTRSGEFKLYRYDTKKLEGFNPDVFGVMATKLSRNRAGLEKFLAVFRKLHSTPSSQIFNFDSVVGIPAGTIAPRSLDIVITSPPYGDSHTTVAYGQYSRLSAAWLDLAAPHAVDRLLMGGKIASKMTHFPSRALNHAIMQIAEIDGKRALEVSSFYADLYNSIGHVSGLVKPNGYACYVVGNRKVKGVVLPTENAICNFFEHFGFHRVDTFHRSIPNKRMPLRNSPTNVAGALDNTMTQEYIVVMRL
jgi:site-specific DNA-methyltransferase (cytosine-N4-specific)